MAVKLGGGGGAGIRGRIVGCYFWSRYTFKTIQHDVYATIKLGVIVCKVLSSSAVKIFSKHSNITRVLLSLVIIIIAIFICIFAPGCLPFRHSVCSTCQAVKFRCRWRRSCVANPYSCSAIKWWIKGTVMLKEFTFSTIRIVCLRLTSVMVSSKWKILFSSVVKYRVGKTTNFGGMIIKIHCAIGYVLHCGLN